GEGKRAFGEVEPLAQDRKPAPPERELADGRWCRCLPCKPDGSAEFGIKPAALYEDLVRRVYGDIERNAPAAATASSACRSQGLILRPDIGRCTLALDVERGKRAGKPVGNGDDGSAQVDGAGDARRGSEWPGDLEVTG